MARAVRHSDLAQIERATTALVACIVQTINDSDCTAQSRFLERLEGAYLRFRDDPRFGDSLHAVEMVLRVRQQLTGSEHGERPRADWR